MKHVRYSDNDHYFGPLTFCSSRGGRTFTIMYVAPDTLDYCDTPHNYLHLTAFSRTAILRLPEIVKPFQRKVVATSWDEATIERLGRDWYWDVDRREFGAYLFENHFVVHFGRQSDDSSTTRSWSRFLPWGEWRHVRTSYYDLAGEHVWTEPERRKGESWDWAAIHAKIDSLPEASFEFDDFDGERIVALTRIIEREWRLGAGWFKWLSLFRRPRIRRSLEIEFSKETGPRKGSWKGGTVGHAIEMSPGELHEGAFRRYCDEHQMKFIAQKGEVAG